MLPVQDSIRARSSQLGLHTVLPGRYWIVYRFFADPNAGAQTMLGNGTEQGYIDTMQATANTGILIAMFAAAVITSASVPL